MADLYLESLISERLCRNEERFLNLERKLELILQQISDLEVPSSNPIPIEKSLEQPAWRKTEAFASNEEQLRILIERQSLRVQEGPQQEITGSILHSSYSPDVLIDRGIHCSDFASSINSTISKFAREKFPVLDVNENVESWIEDCENFFKKYRTSDLNRLYLASHYLCDEAKMWYEQLRKNHDLDWKLFKELLLKKFSAEQETEISFDNIALELSEHAKEPAVKTTLDHYYNSSPTNCENFERDNVSASILCVHDMVGGVEQNIVVEDFVEASSSDVYLDCNVLIPIIVVLPSNHGCSDFHENGSGLDLNSEWLKNMDLDSYIILPMLAKYCLDGYGDCAFVLGTYPLCLSPNLLIWFRKIILNIQGKQYFIWDPGGSSHEQLILALKFTWRTFVHYIIFFYIRHFFSFMAKQ